MPSLRRILPSRVTPAAPAAPSPEPVVPEPSTAASPAAPAVVKPTTTPVVAAPVEAPPRPPRLLRYRSSTLFIVGTICVAIFTDIFLYGLIVPVMPYAMTSRAGIASDDLQRWNTILIACYSIALFVGSPVAGIYADHASSRRAPLLLGLVALAAATVLLCVGRSIAVFAVGRVLQGLSAAVVWSVGLGLLADTMGRRIGLAMGYVSIALSAGLLLAPLIGGAVYAACGYYAVYYVAFGLIALDIVLRLLLVEKKVALRWEKRMAATATATATTTADEERATMTTTTAAAAVVADTTDTADTADTADHTNTNVPDVSLARRMLTLVRSRRMLAALAGSAINAGALTAFDTVLPLFVRDTFAWSSTAAGLLFFALYTPPLALSPPIGLLADRWGAKWLALGGLVALLPLLVCLRFVDHDALSQKVLLCVLLSLLGVALTFSSVPLMAEISFAIEAAETDRPGVWGTKGVYGLGYGLFNLAFALGSAGGSLLAGYVQADYGWATTTWVLAVWCAPGVVVTALGVGEFRFGRAASPPAAATVEAAAAHPSPPLTEAKTCCQQGALRPTA